MKKRYMAGFFVQWGRASCCIKNALPGSGRSGKEDDTYAV